MGDGLIAVPTEVILLAVAIILLIFLVVLIVLWTKLAKLRKSYKSLLNGAGAVDVEQVLIGLQQKYNDVIEKQKKNENELNQIRKSMRKMKSSVSVHRYNAFSETGSDLSFSLAIVDEDLDGVVITGIHSRETTYVYAKPLAQGQSKYTLSPEEKEAIHQSLPQKRLTEND